MHQTKIRPVRRIQWQPTAEQLRQRWVDARTHLWMLRIAGPLSVLIVAVLAYAMVDSWTRTLFAALAVMLGFACIIADRVNRTDVRIAKAAWLNKRLGLDQ